METQGLEDVAAVTPSRTRTAPVFAVVYDSPEGLKVEEFPTRPDAAKFVNDLGADKVIRAYKVSEVITLKTVIKL